MAFTARLPDALKAEADAYAASLGMSLNALLAVALRDYLDSRSGVPQKPAEPAPGPAASPITAKNLQAVATGYSTEHEVRSLGRRKRPDIHAEIDAAMAAGDPIPRAVMRAPCWCGSGKELRRCHRRLRLPTD